MYRVEDQTEIHGLGRSWSECWQHFYWFDIDELCVILLFIDWIKNRSEMETEHGVIKTEHGVIKTEIETDWDQEVRTRCMSARYL